MKVKDISKVLALTSSLMLTALATDVVMSDETLDQTSDFRQRMLEKILDQGQVNDELICAVLPNNRQKVERLVNSQGERLPSPYAIAVARMVSQLHAYADTDDLLQPLFRGWNLGTFAEIAVMHEDIRVIRLIVDWSRAFMQSHYEELLSTMVHVAATNNRLYTLGYMTITLPIPSSTILEVFHDAAATSNNTIIEVLLSSDCIHARGAVLNSIAEHDAREIFDWLMGWTIGRDYNRQAFVDSTFYHAATFGNHPMMEWLGRRDDLRPMTSSYGIALGVSASPAFAGRVGILDMVRWLLSLPEGQRPDEQKIIRTHRNAVDNDLQEVAALLQPHLQREAGYLELSDGSDFLRERQQLLG